VTEHDGPGHSSPVDSGRFGSLDLVPKAREPQKAKDFKTDQEVRWCPGCGDYAILAAMQSFMP
jgi:2-oxoglutarate/2-oxoacid ferredoxin oxidoreductase subunit beta